MSRQCYKHQNLLSRDVLRRYPLAQNFISIPMEVLQLPWVSSKNSRARGKEAFKQEGKGKTRSKATEPWELDSEEEKEESRNQPG
jgi:hypothetical protein